jgi:D-alanyl-D-alanine carboxypeptidase (penicillin-binding protein 5/6)
MLKCIAVVSANDCAVAMAEYLCGTEQAFVDKMNQAPQELGLKDTHFKNCTGLFERPGALHQRLRHRRHVPGAHNATT